MVFMSCKDTVLRKDYVSELQGICEEADVDKISPDESGSSLRFDWQLAVYGWQKRTSLLALRCGLELYR